MAQLERPLVGFSIWIPDRRGIAAQCSFRSWPGVDDQPTDDNALRHNQLKVRLFEMEKVIEVLRTLSMNGSIDRCRFIRGPDEQFDWSLWQSLSIEKPVVAGHSFGGSAALAASARPEKFPLESVIVFDPAIERTFKRLLQFVTGWNAPIMYRLRTLDVFNFDTAAGHQL